MVLEEKREARAESFVSERWKAGAKSFAMV
jgi:hypothetical protein